VAEQTHSVSVSDTQSQRGLAWRKTEAFRDIPDYWQITENERSARRCRKERTFSIMQLFGLLGSGVNKDHIHLAKLRDYYADNGVLPPYSGIAKVVGMMSKGATYAMVRRLAKNGYLATTPDKRIRPKKRFFERELVDTVQAGMPQPANEVLAEPISIDEYLIDTPSKTVLLKIRGDSMVEAGLMPGDIVIVKKGALPTIGDIVVALIDGEYTVKYLGMEKGRYFLHPGNQRYHDIHPHGHLEVFGLVVGCFRKY